MRLIDYLETVWKNDLMMDVLSPNELLEGFTSEVSMEESDLLTDSIFKSKLIEPIYLWNNEAEKVISQKKLLDCLEHHSYELYDNIAGYVIVNEYEL
jgi:hypothetical protein